MTVFNGSVYLKEAIDSVLNQTYRSFEFLIIDDCSTDNSRELIKSYKDSRIRLIENKSNIGLTRSLNFGLKQANSKYIARLDQDDIAMENRIDRQISYLKQHPHIVLLGTWCQFIDEMGNPIAHFSPPTTHQEIVDTFIFYNSFMHSSVMFNRDSVLSVGGYPEDFSYSQDNALWLHLSNLYQVAILPENLVQLRKHSNQTSSLPNMKTVIRLEALRLYKKAIDHSGISFNQKKAGQKSVARAKLDYGLALWQEENLRTAMSYIGTICLHYPLLCVRHLVFKLIYALLGPKGREIGRKIKKRLYHLLST